MDITNIKLLDGRIDGLYHTCGGERRERLYE